jgi:hypothetical protein
MTNVIRNTSLSCQYKTSSANKLVDRKVHFFCFCAITNTRKIVPANLSSWEKPRKLDAAKINTFTVFASSVVGRRFETRSAQTKALVFVNFSNTTRH